MRELYSVEALRTSRVEDSWGLYNDVGVPGWGTTVVIPINELEGGVADLVESQQGRQQATPSSVKLTSLTISFKRVFGRG